MIPSILKEQLSQLLADLSIFYASEKILKNLKSQIESLENVVDEGIYFKYVYDYEKLYNEYKELDNNINEILANSGQINEIINKFSDFNWSIEYFKSIGGDYSIIERYSKLVPDTISRLNIFSENLAIMQEAILNQSGSYILKKKITPLELTLSVVVGVGCIYGIYRLLQEVYNG